MNYLNYNQRNIPLGKEGWLANIFGGGNKNTDNWDKQAGSVTIGGKTYSTNNRNDVVALQDYLIEKGYNLGVTKGTGNFGKNTQAALNKYFASPTPVTTQSSTQPLPATSPSFFTNAKNTVTSWFTKDEKPANSWDQSTGTVSLDGKTYNTSNRDDVVALLNYLIGKGYNVGRTGADGLFGKNTQAALNKIFNPPALPEKGSDQSYWDIVKNDPEFAQYLYTSGGQGAGRRLANLINVGGNYVLGMLNPDGKTVFNLGDGLLRLAIGAALYNKQHGGAGTITDTEHGALGGLGKDEKGNNLKDSGQSFRFSFGTGELFNEAMSNPYHNIYGQSSSRFTDDGWESTVDGYTYNNVWHGKDKNGKDKVVKVMGDGEGNASLREAYDAYKASRQSGNGIQAAMETAASLRGVNTSRHGDVSFIPLEDLEAYAQEYYLQKQRALRRSKFGGRLNYYNYSK